MRKVARLTDRYTTHWVNLVPIAPTKNVVLADWRMVPSRALLIAERYVPISVADGENHAHLTERELNKYSPGAGWFCNATIPYIDTFDTPSGDLEEGDVWEGDRRYFNRVTGRRPMSGGVATVAWRQDGQSYEAKRSDVNIVRSGATIVSVTRKPAK